MNGTELLFATDSELVTLKQRAPSQVMSAEGRAPMGEAEKDTGNE